MALSGECDYYMQGVWTDYGSHWPNRKFMNLHSEFAL